MMSDTGNQLHTRSRRPKRSLTKTSDDNVLGISWKEERELRRAIYVSLRDQHNVSPGQSWMISKLRSRRSSHTNRPGNPRSTTDSPSGAYLLRGSRQRFSPINSNMTNPGTVAVTIATSTLRRAKLRATARLNGIVSSSTRPNSPDWAAAAAALAHGANYAESPRRLVSSVSATRAVRYPRNSTESLEDSVSRTASSVSIESSVSSRAPGGRSKKPASTRNLNRRLKVMRTALRNSFVSTEISRGRTAVSRSSVSTLSTSNDKRNAISIGKQSNSSNKRTAATVPSRRRSQSNRMRSNTRALVAPSKASIKNQIAKKLVSAAATKAKKYSPVSGAAKCQERASVSPDSTPGKDNVRSDRKVSLNGGTSPMDPVSIRRPPALVPAELCQDPNGQPVSVHDFIEFVCYHGTPCLSPRLAWFNEPRTGRTCLGPHCSNEFSKLEDSDLLNTRASRRCIATATPPKHCPQDPVQSTTVGSKVEARSAYGDPVVPSIEDSVSAATNALVFAKSPSVSVAKKMASVHHRPSVTPPKIDLFAALSRSMKPDAGQTMKSDNGDSTHNSSCETSTDRLPSKKVVGAKRSARCPPQPISRTRRDMIMEMALSSCKETDIQLFLRSVSCLT